MNSLFLFNFAIKSCLTGSFVLLYINHRLQPVVMKISPFMTNCRTDLKSQIFITAWSSTCGLPHQKWQLPARQDKLKNDITGSILYSYYYFITKT
jgi:hypothetical protein